MQIHVNLIKMLLELLICQIYAKLFEAAQKEKCWEFKRTIAKDTQGHWSLLKKIYIVVMPQDCSSNF